MHQKPVFYLSFASDVQDALPALRAERQDVHEILRKHAFLEVQQEADTDKKVLFGAFNDYRGRIAVFHYGGHAGKDILRLEDTDLQGKTLLTLIEEEIKANPESLALVFLNGCATESQKDALLKAGVRCVIGTVRHIDDTVAQQFAVKFYEAWAGKGDITVRSAYRIAQAFLTDEPKNQHIRFVEKTGSENDTQTGEWGLYESTEGVADTITLNSLCKINSTDLQQNTQTILQEIQDIKEVLNAKKILPVVVLASTWQDYQTLPADIPIPWQYYGESPAEWKPYLCDNIEMLLQEFEKKSNLPLKVYYINRFEMGDDEWENNFRQDVCPQVICVTDAFALNFKENYDFAMLFNRCPVGGFLVPVSATFTQAQKQHSKDKFKDFKELRTSWQTKFNKPYLFIDLDIPHKFLLFRRLADIAFKHLEFETKISNDHLNVALEQKNTKVSKSQDL